MGSTGGWNRPAANQPTVKKGGAKAPSKVKGIVAGIVTVCALGGLCLLMFSGGDDAPKAKAEKKPTKIKEVTPAPAPKAAAAKVAAEVKPTVNLPPEKQIVEMISSKTNDDGLVVERYRTADGKTHSRQIPPKPMFETCTDQAIAMALIGEASGHSMPPIPVSSNADEEFRKSLEKDIVIDDADSDEARRIKLAVKGARESIREMMDKGMKFAEIIQDHQKEVNDNVSIRNGVIKDVKQFLAEGDRESAEKYLFKVNIALQQMGIEEVSMPLSKDERRALARSRREQMEEAK